MVLLKKKKRINKGQKRESATLFIEFIAVTVLLSLCEVGKLS